MSDGFYGYETLLISYDTPSFSVAKLIIFYIIKSSLRLTLCIISATDGLRERGYVFEKHKNIFYIKKVCMHGTSKHLCSKLTVSNLIENNIHYTRTVRNVD